jgi:hypothetical protein
VYAPHGSSQSFEPRNAAVLVEKIDAAAIDRVFTTSTQLSGPAIVDFVKALCKVRMELLCSSAAVGAVAALVRH